MNPFTGLRLAKLASFAAVLVVSGSALSVSAPSAEQLAEPINTKVIIILRDQVAGVPAAHGAMQARAAALSGAQQPVMAELQRSNSARIHAFRMINAVSATVSKSEIARLAAHPLVQAVLPDRVIKAARRPSEAGAVGGAAAALSPAGSSAGANAALCNTLEPQALQLTNTAFLDESIPQAQRVKDGNGKYVTGEGVKVAWIADGLDPTVPGFTRTDGKPVFFDYQNFDGDPAGTPTQGEEAFGDASSIAAQDTPNGNVLQYDITKYVAADAPPLPTPCNIRIRGMAPGARLAGFDVFSSDGFTTNSAFVQAIEWAVLNDDVDVINESFGNNPWPDNDDDPISLVDRAAVAAGVTVVVSTGDAGSAGTIGSAATSPEVINSGATTQFRLYAQTGYPAPMFTMKGYIDNNISPFSSGGFAQTNARTVDTVAPGDSAWALCSTNPTLFTSCVSFAGTATPIQDFGGTSESSPLTAGAAALVIQAYRSTHGGASPSPALVKTILMGTATDLGAPASEQGAGLINSLAAVNAALSIGRSPQGQSVLHYPTSVSLPELPNTGESRTFTLTNYGSSPEWIAPSLQRLGPAIAGATLGLSLPGNITFPNDAGAARQGVKQTFNVPAGAQHLDVSVAFKPSTTAIPVILMALLDPSGKLAIYNDLQGANNGFSHVDIVNPGAGTWTAYVYTHPSDAETYTGPVVFTWAAERYVSFGSVSSSGFWLAPGASTNVTASFNMPSQAGDSAAALRFGRATGEIPLSLRTLVPVSSSGGSFSGTLTGGNARPGVGPTQTFAFNVPPGAENISLSLRDSDPGSPLEGLLVDPNGMQLSVQPNSDPTGTIPSGSLQMFHYNPQPGQWRFVLVQNFSVSGNETSLPFTGHISFYGNSQVVSGLPNTMGSVSAAKGATFPIEITNNGKATEWYFTDARLRNPVVTPLTVFQLTSLCPNGTLQLELVQGFPCLFVYVPTEAGVVQFVAGSDKPVNMDVENDVGANIAGTGSPDLWAYPVAKDTMAATLVVPEVPWGLWLMSPSLVGPYGSSGVSTTQPLSTATAAALMQPFDTAVSGSQGDAWADLVNNGAQFLSTGTFATFKPLPLAPGGTGTITITVKPSASQVGTTVQGYLYIDTYNQSVGTGDEVARIPYSYTVTP